MKKTKVLEIFKGQSGLIDNAFSKWYNSDVSVSLKETFSAILLKIYDPDISISDSDEYDAEN